jgi:lipid-A-disaccharide synthase
VGHPYFDQLRAEQVDEGFIQQLRSKSGPLVAILPGSRTQEVKGNFGYFLKAAKIVHDRIPDARFAVASFKPSQAEFAKELLKGSKLPIEVHVGRTGEIIRAADCAMAVSGSVSLELLYHTTPTVILYYVTRFAYFVQTFLRKVRYITLVNLLTATDLFPKKVATYDPADPIDAHVLMPEFLTCGDRSEQVANHVIEWLYQPAKREARVAQLAALKEQVGHGGASSQAADYMISALDARRPAALRTHHSFDVSPEQIVREAA